MLRAGGLTGAAPQREGWSDIALAAEFKRASPSKGDIATQLNLQGRELSTAAAGAGMGLRTCAMRRASEGAARDVVQGMNPRPAILRKDFIIDAYQLLEARAYGADCVLLIVALLPQEKLIELIDLDIALAARARLIGVNNRDLRTFKVDLNTTARVADAIRERGLSLGRDGITLFALSGIRSHADVVKYENCGARGILVGEFLMKSGDVATTVKELLQAVTHHSELGDLPLLPPLAKVCGVTTVEYALAALRNGANMIGIIMAEHSPRYVLVETAKAIAKAVREYGERTGPILPEILDTHLDGKNDWFHRNVLALREACSRAPLVVGVFANKAASEMNVAAEEIGLDLVQLHGDEGFDICKDIKYPTIRALHLPDTALNDGVDAEAILQQVQEGLANYILLDTTMKGQQGGTGVAFDWKIAAIFTHARIPCLMAGGLTPENVVKAVSVGHPVGVDVSSGVEVKGSPGVKDLDKVAAFLKAVKDYLSVAALKIDEEKETVLVLILTLKFLAHSAICALELKSTSCRPAAMLAVGAWGQENDARTTEGWVRASVLLARRNSRNLTHPRLAQLCPSHTQSSEPGCSSCSQPCGVDQARSQEQDWEGRPSKTLVLQYWERTDECLERKWAHMDMVDELFESREELILATTLSDTETALEPNMFPYDTPEGIEHWTLWSRHEMDDDEIKKYVSGWLSENAPHVESWNYDENLSRSIDIFHVHVYLQGVTQPR
ncbi:unnamed protein product [Phytophthora fragariaefolia]|uniref:Unnamed protein product n=1 Tax=Phytophthora fragariaefolia TaxID=1490495 RepID=A0A9W7CZC5_9STRA|nr:unnamed protein product [Phytophthora fragariaefolia]